ncbi:MAG: 4-alpha-glucanotransferase [Clostridium sp.]|uniref:4-alpha-glucanotransferase n=1 Tax=Clostridium sp. TaxID=1506 RepID=UPI001ED0B522|nr:4-alpha-glucanotransferase [Clostridium sp.]MBS5884710.1 4-alpha-glucanotransferase [Clostridium sp.]MDU7149407.1 4-alpha-glucanotransferase [Clostridium sp.]MDU7242665.1 4-alpha-glucanotransferase [Clostridium sp.]
MKRSSGILMHISSLPGKYGIGTFGMEAVAFIDFLKKSGQKYWQILPLGQTSYGDSPYQCFSAFAGNPYFIDFELLEKEGLLAKEDYSTLDYGLDENCVDYAKLFINKNKVLRIVYQNSKNKYDEEINKFINENKFWLEDYALYMAVKNHFNLVSWQNWDDDIRLRKEEAIDSYKLLLKDEIDYWIFVQYIFFKQWNSLKKYANDNGIEIIGDIPIYVAEDSADIWSNPEYFNVDENMLPITVAGCPPDTFSSTGQLWGNPIYNWDNLDKDGYSWWIDRVRESFKLYDVVRIDHFRGFEAYWEIPYGNKTAEFGQWTKGPGIKLFNAIKDKLGDVNIIAEDLGMMTDEVIELRDTTGFPGMKILQFGFGEGDSRDLPHNYPVNCVAYTGTHDNDTVCGWYNVTGSKKEIEKAKKYLNLTYEEGIAKGLIRGVWGSPAYLAITTMQDLLGLGNDARMNMPSTLGGNWVWRASSKDFNDKLAKEVYDLTKLYGR